MHVSYSIYPGPRRIRPGNLKGCPPVHSIQGKLTMAQLLLDVINYISDRHVRLLHQPSTTLHLQCFLLHKIAGLPQGWGCWSTQAENTNDHLNTRYLFVGGEEITLMDVQGETVLGYMILHAHPYTFVSGNVGFCTCHTIIDLAQRRLTKA